jgi:RES domain-containing protein
MLLGSEKILPEGIYLYRLANAEYAKDLTGTGGLYASGRWHTIGRPIIYTSLNSSTAILEALANLETVMPQRARQLAILKVTRALPIWKIDADQLEDGWRNYLSYPRQTLELGNRFLAERTYLGLLVPSAQNPMEQNLILNPLHGDMSCILIQETVLFELDPRLIR